MTKTFLKNPQKLEDSTEEISTNQKERACACEREMMKNRVD